MIVRLLILVTVMVMLASCAAGMHGYTKGAAQNQYMKVDAAKESFGYKRVMYIVGYRGAAMKAFLDEKGNPNFLYEFEENGREAFIFYYLMADKAYVFKERSWRPDSAALTEIRPLTEFEKKRFDAPTAEADDKK